MVSWCMLYLTPVAMAEGKNLVKSDMCKYYGFQTKEQQWEDDTLIYLYIICAGGPYDLWLLI